MAAEGRFVTQAEVSDLVSAATLLRVLADTPGAINEDALQLIIDNEESIVIGAATTEYDDASLPADPEEAAETHGGRLLKRITLSLVKGEIFDRHPEWVRADGQSHKAEGMKLVSMLATAKLRLQGLGDPANVGGEVIPFDGDQEEPVRFWNGDGGTGYF